MQCRGGGENPIRPQAVPASSPAPPPPPSGFPSTARRRSERCQRSICMRSGWASPVLKWAAVRARNFIILYEHGQRWHATETADAVGEIHVKRRASTSICRSPTLKRCRPSILTSTANGQAEKIIVSDPVKIDYLSPSNSKPKKSVRKIVAEAIGLSICLFMGVAFLIIALPFRVLNLRFSAMLILISLIFIMQAIRLIRRLACGV